MISSAAETGGNLAGRRVLVTGASGFLGSHLCEALVRSGADTHGISRVERHAESDRLHWWKAELTDAAVVRELWKAIRPDVVIHLSALSSAAPDMNLVLPTFASILASTVNILTVSAELGCRRIVLAASLTEPLPGSPELIASSPYAAAKWASSVYGLMFSRLYQLPVVIVRPFMTFGPRQDVRKLIPYVTLSLLQGEAPKVGGGNWEADWIYVDDVIQGFLGAAQAPNLDGCTIDLGSGELVSVRRILDCLVDLTGSGVRPIFGAVPDRPLESIRTADTAFAFEKLGFKASVPLMDGLQRTVDWYRRQIPLRAEMSSREQ